MPHMTSDQALMRDSARRLFESCDGPARVRRAATQWPSVDKTVWTQFASMGWISLLVPHDSGGMGGNASDFVALLDGVSDLLSPEPLIPVLATAPLLASCATEAAKQLLESVLHGERIILAATEGQPSLQKSATHSISDAHWADMVVFGMSERDGFVLRAVEVGGESANLSMSRTIDGGSLSFATLDASSGYQIGAGEQVQIAFERCRNMQRLGAAASLVGLAQEAFRTTVDYMKLRRQFGVPIGSFQALQHRAASLHVAGHAARALVYEAARTIGTAKAALACAAAKAKACETATKVVKESVQIHGAIGFSDESDIALFFRRAIALAAAYGSSDTCRREAFASLEDGLHRRLPGGY